MSNHMPGCGCWNCNQPNYGKIFEKNEHPALSQAEALRQFMAECLRLQKEREAILEAAKEVIRRWEDNSDRTWEAIKWMKQTIRDIEEASCESQGK